MSADLEVLDSDLLTAAPEKIGEAHVLLTLFRGQQTYRDMGI